MTCFRSKPQVQKGMRKEVSVLIPVNTFHRRKGCGSTNQQASPLNIPHNAAVDIRGLKTLETVPALLPIHVSLCSWLESHTQCTGQRWLCACCSLRRTEPVLGQGFRSAVGTAGMPMFQSETTSLL